LGAANSRSLRSESYARIKELEQQFTSIPFRRFLGDVRRECIIQRCCAVLHGTLDSYLRDALHMGGANVDDCFPAPRVVDFVPCFFYFHFFASGSRYFLCNETLVYHSTTNPHHIFPLFTALRHSFAGTNIKTVPVSL
jgi:hypothetical protein